ncbi:MAG: DUF3084 domain-containing protein [Cyanobacteriota bacterium]|nr:DUF3084 domain-containing protein [Cyanobacteriota bacterium]
MSGWLLILALLMLGGILSTLGDRLGSKVGKARLSLFNLRPRKTAVVITALTGSLISGISLGLMLLVSERLRVGLFELDQLQERLRDGRQALSRSQADLQRSKGDLERNRQELKTNQQALKVSRIERNRALEGRQAAIASERKVTQALSRAQRRVGDLRRELQPLQNQRRRLESERDRLTREVKGRDAEIQRTEKQLAGVQARIEAGAKELKELEGKVIALRRGDVLIASGQPLAMGRIKLGRQEDGRQAIDTLLQQANASAFRLLLPGQKADRQILLVPRSDIERLNQAIRKPGVWVVTIRSAANILRGEQRVLAFPDLRPNRNVVRPGDVLARTVLDGDVRSAEEVRSRLNLLLAAAFTQAQRQGTLVDGLQVDGADFNRLTLILSRRPEGVRATVEAVALAPADTPDPIAVELRWTP